MVEAIVDDELPAPRRPAAPAPPRPVPAGARRPPCRSAAARVHVVDQQSVLGIVDAWLAHRAQGGDDLLVVVHPLDDDQLGWDVRGHAVRRAHAHGRPGHDRAAPLRRHRPGSAGAAEPVAGGRPARRRADGRLAPRRAGAHARRGGPRAARGPPRVDEPPDAGHAARLVAGARACALPRAAGRGARRADRLARRRTSVAWPPC